MYKTKSHSKILILLGAVAVVFGILVFNIVKTDKINKNNWQNFASFDYEITIEKDEVTGENVAVYNIENANQLAGVLMSDSQKQEYSYADNHTNVSTYKNNIYRLKSNIDLINKSWVPSNLGENVTFEGNGYSISNLKCTNSYNAGFISTNSGTIKNVVFKNVGTSKGTSSIGSAFGVVAAINNGTISYCTVEVGSPQITSFRYAGGIAGYCGENSVITNCLNFLNINNEDIMYVGGITSSASSAILSHNANYGVITADIVGGIVGNVSGLTEINNCINEANITSKYYVGVAGGIVGQSSASYNNTIKNCQNLKNISDNGQDKSYIGGIIGNAKGKTTSTISSCINKGKVKSTALIESMSGGIAGYCTYNIEKCGNQGEVYAGVHGTDTTVTERFYKSGGELRNCSFNNIKTGTDLSYAGGIVGKSEAIIYNCFNLGKIEALAQESSPTYCDYEKADDMSFIENTTKYLVDGESGFLGSGDNSYIHYRNNEGSWTDYNGKEYKSYVGVTIWSTESLAYGAGIAGSAKNVSNSYNNSTDITGTTFALYVVENVSFYYFGDGDKNVDSGYSVCRADRFIERTNCLDIVGYLDDSINYCYGINHQTGNIQYTEKDSSKTIFEYTRGKSSSSDKYYNKYEYSYGVNTYYYNNKITIYFKSFLFEFVNNASGENWPTEKYRNSLCPFSEITFSPTLDSRTVAYNESTVVANDYWAQSDGINNGNPYPSGWYWGKV